MLRLSIALKRRADLTRTQFLEHWRDRHAPLVKALAADLGIRRYVQVHSLRVEELIAAGLPVDAAGPFDGLAEVWFDGAMLLAATSEAKAARRRLREDEARFIATESSVSWWGAAHLIIGDGFEL